MEQIAIAIVFIVTSIAAIIVKWALGAKKDAEFRAENEKFKRMESEIKNEVNSKSLDNLIDDSNKRHKRGE